MATISRNTLSEAQGWEALRALLPRDGLVTDPVELIAYELDGSLGHGVPQAVVLPRRAEEVVAAVKWAAGRGIPVIPRGAGTGLSGGSVATRGGIIISFARMTRIVEMDEVGRSIVVEPGIVHQVLDEFVKGYGLYYPPDPASGRAATLGGNLAENAGGPHCFKYGVTTNYVTGLQVVLADGRVIQTGGRAYDYPELDLTGLLVGSEGTLGIVTRADLRLIRNIPGVKTLMAVFDSVEQAGEAVSAVIARGLIPATLEMMDRNMIGIVEAYAHAGLPTDAEALLIIEADGYPESLEPQMAEFVAVMEECRAREMRMARTAAERDQIWYARKSAFGAIAQISPAYYIVDGTVPRSRLADALRQINQVCASHDLRVGYVFHAGDGNLHPLVLFDPEDADMVKRVLHAGHEIMELCLSLGGTITGEHGVGSEKRKYMPLMFSPDELTALRDIKEVFDPGYLLNPGKIIPDEIPAPEPRATPPRVPDSPFAPRSDAEAAEALVAWTGAGRRVRIQGGRTKSSLMALHEEAGDAVLSTAALQGIRALSANDLFVTVGAGTRLADLQRELSRARVWVPLVSPWPASTIGGIVATNFNAPLRMRYGALRDLLLAATFVLPDGRVVRGGRAVVKNVAGYDLLKLFIGAHGTLGLITDVTLKLLPFPRLRASLVAPLDDLGRGLELGGRLLRVCLVASALLMCRTRDLPVGDAASSAPYQLVYTAEGLAEDVRAELAEASAVLQGAGVQATTYWPEPGSPGEPPDLARVPSGSVIWADWLGQGHPTVRVGVAPKDLSGLLVDLAPVLGDGSFVADFACGMLYLRDVPDLEPIRQMARARKGYAIVLPGPVGMQRATFTGGSGFDPWGHAPDGLDLMRALKARWDPRALLNPGAFLI